MNTPQSHVSARQAAALLNVDDRTLRRAIQRKELAARPGPTRNSPSRIEMADLQAYAAANGITLHADGHQVDARTGEVVTSDGSKVVTSDGSSVVAQPTRRAPGASSSEWVERAIRAETLLEQLAAVMRQYERSGDHEGLANGVRVVLEGK